MSSSHTWRCPLRFEAKASQRPSGDQRGLESAAASLVSASLRLDDATVHANAASSALSGAIHGDRSTLTSITASDLGSGDTANAPQDLRWEGGGYDFSGSVAVNCATACE